MLRMIGRWTLIWWMSSHSCGLGVFMVLPSECWADEQHKETLAGDGLPAAPDEWTRIGRSSQINVLQMLGEQSKGNYEQIRTWKGRYRVRLQEALSRQYVAKAYGTTLGAEKVSALIEKRESTMGFAIEIESGSVYREQVTSEMRWFRPGSGEPVEIPDRTPGDERSISSREHFVHFDPKAVWPAFTMLPDFPDAQNKRAAFRDPPPQNLESHHYGDLMDPRSFFACNPGLKFWDEVGMYISATKGSYGADMIKKAEERLTVFEAVAPDGRWYRVFTEMTAPDGASSQYMSTVWSPASGYNPVSYMMSTDRPGKQPINIKQWRWKRVNGVYVPERVKVAMYALQTGELSYQREVELTECAVNEPLDADQFDYTGLGLQDGDLIVDKIENAVLIMKDGQPEKLADFGAKYTGPGQGMSTSRWLFIAGNVVLLAVLLILFARKRRKRRGLE